MSKETGLMVYDDSPFAQLLRKIQSIPTRVYNFLFPQAARPLDSQGSSFPEKILELIRRDDVRFLFEALREKTPKEIERVEPEKLTIGGQQMGDNRFEVPPRDGDDIPFVIDSRLAATIERHNKAIMIGEAIRGRRRKGRHTKDKHPRGGEHTEDIKGEEKE